MLKSKDRLDPFCWYTWGGGGGGYLVSFNTLLGALMTTITTCTKFRLKNDPGKWSFSDENVG